ncbi:MAG: G8 domain-containing protein [Proteobacteria bacterium]|jgi:hypothetical protein|nr:G8 domain-containing protein [Pseudomonadota bacterium]
MATKTSNGTGGGTWSVGATWSGGVAPTIGTDDVVIASTDTVTCDLNSTTPSKGIVVNGILSFSTTASTKLTMGNYTIAIGATGELRIGTVGSVLDKAYTAEILWDTTTDGANGITIADGGKLTLYGDPLLYSNILCTSIADFCTVTGTLSPDVTGYYYPTSDYPSGWNDHTVYQRDGLVGGAQYFIWYDADVSRWRLSAEVGGILPYRWLSASAILNSTFNPGGNSTGVGTCINGWQPSLGLTFTVVGDVTTTWANGQELLIHKNGTYSQNIYDSFADAGLGPATIVSLVANSSNSANTDIQIAEAYTGRYYNTGRVYNLDRNIRVGKLSASTDFDATPNNRPIIIDDNSTSGNVNVSNVVLTGFYRPFINTAGTSISALFARAIIRNSELSVCNVSTSMDVLEVANTIQIGANRLDQTAVASYSFPNYGAVAGGGG